MQAPAGGQGAQAQNLGSRQRGRRLPRSPLRQDQVVGDHQVQIRQPPQAGEGIGQHRPAAAALPAPQGLHMAGPGGGVATPGARHHHPGAVGVQGPTGRHGAGGRGEGMGPWCTGGGFGGGLHREIGPQLVRQPGQIGASRMQGLIEGEIEMHRPRRPARPVPHGRDESPQGQGLQLLRGRRRQPLVRASAQPAAAAAQEGLLVDALVGAATLQPRRPVGREQQKGDGAEIGLHRGRQQVGDRRARGGDHRRRQAAAPAEAEGEEGGGALVNGRVQLQATGLQQGGGHCQGGGAAAGTQHHMGQSGPAQGPEQRQGRTKVGQR